MNHISIGKKEGATVHLGGERHGTEGFFIQPTIFTDVKPEMTIVKEEIFGPGTHLCPLQFYWWPLLTDRLVF